MTESRRTPHPDSNVVPPGSASFESGAAPAVVGNPRIEKFTTFLVKFRHVLLLLALLSMIPASALSMKLKFDQSIESLYAEDDEFLLAYRDSKALFGGDEFAIVGFQQSGMFEPADSSDGTSHNLTKAANERIIAFANRLGSIPGVRADSTQDLARSLRFPYRRGRVLELVEGVLIGEDRTTTAVVIRFLPESESEVSRAETIRMIREAAESHDPPAHVVGEPVQVHEMFRYVEEDGRKLFWWSLALLAAVLFILFRRFLWVLLPLIVVVAAIVWTEAILVLSQVRLSMVSSMLNSLVTIIGIATTMHITIQFRERRKTCEPEEALRQTLATPIPAIFWTCVTTGIGFAVLYSSEITPVRSFGLMMTLATMLVLVAALVILPGGILSGPFFRDPRSTPAEQKLLRGLAHVEEAVHRRPLWIGGFLLALTIVVGLGFFRLHIETDFSKNFRESSTIVRALDFIETRLGGAGNWEVNFPAPRELTDDYLSRVRRLGERLSNIKDDQGRPALTKVMPLTDGLDLIPSEIDFLLGKRRIPLNQRLMTLRVTQSEYESTLYNADAGRMRILLRARERQPSESKLKLIADVERITREEFPVGEFAGARPATATGLFVLLAHLIESLLRDQIVSFFLAAIGIVLAMSLAFRSVWIGIASLLPNLFPIVLVIGGMGWVGLPVNIATAMIASVSMGLTVDSSVHYISGFRRARRRGASVREAIQETNSDVGRALVFANVALVVGFSVLTLSHFIPLIYFGILVSVAILGGLVGNLLLLPLLLTLVEGRGENISISTAPSETLTNGNA